MRRVRRPRPRRRDGGRGRPPYLAGDIGDETGRPNTEEDLREREGLLSAIFASNPAAIGLTTVEGRFIDLNPHYFTISGYSREEMVGRTAVELGLWTEKEQSRAAAWVRQHGPLRDYETVIRTRSGKRRFVVISAHVVTRGTSRRLLHFINDITARKEADRALRRSTRWLRLISEATFEGIVLVEDGRFRKVNDQFARMLGYTKDEITGMEVASVLHPQDLSLVLSNMTEARESTTVHRAVRKDGSVIIVESHGKSLFFEGRRVRLSAVRDITQHKRTEEALKTAYDGLEQRVRERTGELSRAYRIMSAEVEERKKLEEDRKPLVAAMENAAEAVLVVDAGFTITHVNPAFCDITGYSKEDVIGRNMAVMRVVEKEESFYEEIRDALAGSQKWRGIYPTRCKDGTTKFARANISSIKDASGAVTHYVVVADDITEQLRLEDHLRQAHKMEAVGTLAGGIAHDFNNILAVIIGNAELALDDVVESGPRENIKQIFTASTRARDLVKQILTFSRKDGQQQKPLRLTPLVKETYQMLRASVPSTVEMRLSVRTTADTVVADPSQIQQVLINLVSNAAHAMQESGGRLSITLSTRSACSVSDPDVQPGRFVQISVKDTGGGMTPDVQRRIFEPFFTTKEQGRGTGMGLAVVYGIVKRHGGFITVESRTGQGSTFVVSLPLSQEGRARKEERSSLPPLGSERILFVDDEPPIARTTEDMLRRLGYRVVAVIDSTKAWEIFLEDPFQFDLVITDQAMPSFSGTALAKKMLALRPDIPIILCTGYSETVSPEKAKELGIRVFLMKPFDKRRLAAAVRQALDAREGRP